MSDSPQQQSTSGRAAILTAAFLGWLTAGAVMGLGPLAARPALRDLLPGDGRVAAPWGQTDEGTIGTWFAWYLCVFLLGGAVGGLAFGRLGDRQGRVRALGLSILCFSVFTGAGWLARTPGQLLVLRFLASLGIGGTWPAGVALLSEAWPEASRPSVAGVMGSAANIGILLMALLGQWLSITPDSWRWTMLVGAAPLLLGVWVLLQVPESPRWLAQRFAASKKERGPLTEVFRPPLLSRTMLGILLGTIPLIGTWASGKWMIPWANARGADAAQTQAIWAVGAVLGSAAGGWLASRLGRRVTYFLVSLAALLVNLAIYRLLDPLHRAFLPAVFLLGLVATVFFGWLPLYLPELFPTRVRATGTGVAYNFGRIVSALGVLGAGSLMAWFQGDYARVGEVTAWVYGLGTIVILFAPDTSKSVLRD
ncbi:MAG TPA: MFS transporter [Gemmataceae bacterium]|jgi:MFS family permease